MSLLPPMRHATVLLDAPLGVICERIRRRGRDAEKETDAGKASVPHAYLQDLQAAHEEYYASLPAAEKRLVRATTEPEAVAEEVPSAPASPSGSPPICVAAALTLPAGRLSGLRGDPGAGEPAILPVIRR